MEELFTSRLEYQEIAVHSCGGNQGGIHISRRFEGSLSYSLLSRNSKREDRVTQAVAILTTADVLTSQAYQPRACYSVPLSELIKIPFSIQRR